jgi:GH18 family chitinase
MMPSSSRFAVEPLERRQLLAATELIRNGGFEGVVSETDWVRSGNFQADSRFSSPRTGSGYAYFANLDGSAGNSITGTLYQQFSIPSNTTSLTLNFWTRISTSETTSTLQNDTMSIAIQSQAGTTLQTLTTLSNLNAGSSYVQRTYALNRALIGQTVRLAFTAANNATLATTFRVDDVSLNAVSPATSNRVVGYLPYYRYSSAFSKLDWGALTHVNYFAVTASDTGALTTTNVTAAALNNVVSTAHAAGVTVGITIGPHSFSTLAASATARQAFANNIVNYALQYNLDCIDIDWEPPAGNNNANYANLINDLHTLASPQKIMITAAVNPLTNEIPAATVNAKMNWLNLMCYHFTSSNHSTYTQSVNAMLDWTNFGVQKNKLVMGVPFYGLQGPTYSDPAKIYSTIMSEALAANGEFPSPEIDFVSPFYFNGVETIRKKSQYVLDNGYGGMMIWEVGQDRWNTSAQYDHRSLLPVMKSVFLQNGAFTSVTMSPSDNGNAPIGGTQSVLVTVTFNAPSAGVLQVALVDEAVTPASNWTYIAAGGTVTRTLSIPVSEPAAGQQFYEVYTQFRPGASSGPLLAIDDTDLLKLTPYRLNWVQFPAAPSSPSPNDGASLVTAPVLFDWANAANASSYDVIVNGVLRANVTSSQWTSNVSFAPGVNHTWQVVARNTNGTTSGQVWSFTWVAPDTTPPSVNGGDFNVDTRQVTILFSEEMAEVSGDAFISLQSGGTDVNVGPGILSASTMTFTLPMGLADGDYQFRLPTTSVSDLANNPLAADWTLPFYLLTGDVNRDRAVNFDDLLIVAQNYGTTGRTFSQGNLNYDATGNVDFDDLLLLAQKYGTSLQTAPSLTSKLRRRPLL